MEHIGTNLTNKLGDRVKRHDSKHRNKKGYGKLRNAMTTKVYNSLVSKIQGPWEVRVKDIIKIVITDLRNGKRKLGDRWGRW